MEQLLLPTEDGLNVLFILFYHLVIEEKQLCRTCAVQHVVKRHTGVVHVHMATTYNAPKYTHVQTTCTHTPSPPLSANTA